MLGFALVVFGQLGGASGTSMNLNQNPILCMDEGLYCRADRKQAFELNCSGSGISCAQTGGRMTVNVTGGGGGGSPGVTCAADEALTWNGTAYSCLSKIRAAFMADAGITAQQLANDPVACSAGQFVTDVAADGTLTCATPSGGGGGTGVNTASGSAYFDGGTLDALTTVSAAWATTGSVILCRPSGEEASIEGLQVTVISQSTGSFVVRSEPRQGSHWGSMPFVCMGN
jgi:hypothetical protein